jgi:hypothetical protein
MAAEFYYKMKSQHYLKRKMGLRWGLGAAEGDWVSVQFKIRRILHGESM